MDALSGQIVGPTDVLRAGIGCLAD